MASREIAAPALGDALKLFARQSISVQTATPAKAKGDDGKEREVWKTAMAPLSAELVLAARQYDDGRVSITTIDGKRYSAQGPKPKPEKNGGDE